MHITPRSDLESAKDPAILRDGRHGNVVEDEGNNARHDLHTLDGFFEAVVQGFDGGHWLRARGNCFCPRCGEIRTVEIRMASGSGYTGPHIDTNEGASSLAHQPFLLTCPQCDTTFTAMVYPGPGGTEHMIVPHSLGSHATPNTPSGVAYYLDQAARAERSGATSAAVAMYRGALEQLLFERGFTGRTLATKIKDAFDQQSDRRLVIGLEEAFFTRIRELGNGSVHPNDGDVERQKSLDRDLLAVLHVVFSRILNEIYELPAQRKAQLDKLTAAASVVNPPHKG